MIFSVSRWSRVNCGRDCTPGARILSLEADLAARNTRLSEALRQIEQDLELAARIQQSVLPAHQLCYQGFSPTGFSCRRPGYRGDIF